jgi:Carboxypeptidase regulatory-like domain
LVDVFVSIHSPSTGVDGSTSTAVDGTYTVPGLPAGTDYQVCFDASRALGGSSDASGYIDQCYDNQPTSGTATPVTVTAGANRTGINATLAVGGAVSGTVTDAGGTNHGLGHVWVSVGSGGPEKFAWTAADGTYTVPGLPAGTNYTVCFDASGAKGGSSDAIGYVDQCYDNQPTSGTPTPVTVTPGATRTGINAALAVGGAASGTVIDAGGTNHGLANVSVEVASESTGAEKYGTTAADGTWSVPGLPAGTDYTVCFTDVGATGGSSDATGYVDQCYDNQPISGTPTPVTVTAGTTRSGIDAALVGKP